MAIKKLDEKHALKYIDITSALLAHKSHCPTLRKVLRRNSFQVTEIDLRGARSEKEAMSIFCKAIKTLGVPAEQIAATTSSPAYTHEYILRALHQRNLAKGARTALVFHLPKQWNDEHPVFRFMTPVLKPSTILQTEGISNTVKKIAVYHGDTLPSGGYIMIFGECAHVPTK